MTRAHIGAASAHESASLHVRGTAIYIDDIREPAGTLHLAPGAAECAHGVIRSVDLSRVRDAPGVVAVLTAADIPGDNNCSPSMHDDAILAENEVVFHGQVVFVAVARSREQARRAVRLGRIEVEPTPPLIEVEDGLAAGAQVLQPYRFERGDPDSAIRQSHHRTEGSLRIGGQEHFYLEGQVSLAIPGEDGPDAGALLDPAPDGSATFDCSNVGCAKCCGGVRMPPYGWGVRGERIAGGPMGLSRRSRE